MRYGGAARRDRPIRRRQGKVLSQQLTWRHRLIRNTSILIATLATLAASNACAQVYVPQPDLNFPRIRYADSLVSMNDRCMVRQSRLGLSHPPVYVSRQPVGFC